MSLYSVGHQLLLLWLEEGCYDAQCPAFSSSSKTGIGSLINNLLYLDSECQFISILKCYLSSSPNIPRHIVKS